MASYPGGAPLARDQLESLAPQIYRSIRNEMLGGTLRIGQRINESELARRFGTSKTPVREALARLVHEELLEVFPRVGYRVKTMDPAEVENLFTFRAILEGATVDAAVDRMTDADLERIKILAESYGDTDRQDTYLDFFARNRAFHLEIARCSGNPYLLRALDGVFDKVELALLVLIQGGESPAELELEHRKLVSALARRDGPTARRRNEESIDRMKRNVVRLLVQRQVRP